MPRMIAHPNSKSSATTRVRPSVVDPTTAQPFTLEQELLPFGRWVGEPVWVPPKDSSELLSESMLEESRPFSSKDERWQAVVSKHRDEFTQVREFDLFKASIRLPKGRFFVTVTEQKDFDTITETVPDCVQTRLDEFLQGPGNRPGVKVYYLKPLCVESGDQLIFSTADDLTRAITKIQDEVFAEYASRAPAYRASEAIRSGLNLSLALPRRVVKYFVNRRQKAIDAYQARLEFKRRKTALGAARTHGKCRTNGCTFDEMLELTNPLERTAVVAQYCEDQQLSQAKREQLMHIAAGSIPWFIGLSIGGGYFGSMAAYMLLVPPVMVCDPAFVAEMPDRPGTLLKIGHFDEVAGVTHVEI